MSYSLISPSKRPLFKLFTRLCMYCITIIFILLLVLNFFIIFKNYSLSKNTKNLLSDSENFNNKIVKIDTNIKNIRDKLDLAKDIYTSNMILKRSLNNLFSLVPDSITLKEILMEKNLLIIKGITPSKDLFNQRLSLPLKSIFSSSHTDFLQMQNGWFNFVNTSKIDILEGYNE